MFVPFNNAQSVKGEFTSPTINNSIDIECGFIPTAISIRQKTNGNLISLLYDIRNTPEMVTGSNLGSIAVDSSKEYTYMAME